MNTLHILITAEGVPVNSGLWQEDRQRYCTSESRLLRSSDIYDAD